jgi:hypothetical protein
MSLIELAFFCQLFFTLIITMTGVTTYIYCNFDMICSQLAETIMRYNMKIINRLDDDTISKIVDTCSKRIFIPIWYTRESANIGVDQERWEEICDLKESTSSEDFYDEVEDLTSQYLASCIEDSSSDVIEEYSTDTPCEYEGSNSDSDDEGPKQLVIQRKLPLSLNTTDSSSDESKDTIKPVSPYEKHNEDMMKQAMNCLHR